MYLPELKGSKGVLFKFDGFPGTRGTRANEGPVLTYTWLGMNSKSHHKFLQFSFVKCNRVSFEIESVGNLHTLIMFYKERL